MIVCYTMYIALREGERLDKHKNIEFEIFYESVTAREEQETVISYDRSINAWHLYTNVPTHARKWEATVIPSDAHLSSKTYRKSPKELIGISGIINGSISIRKKKEYTEEELEELRERMNKNVHGKKNE